MKDEIIKHIKQLEADTINYFHGELLNINGWDIKNTLKVIRKSNATPFEWAQSPSADSPDG